MIRSSTYSRSLTKLYCIEKDMNTWTTRIKHDLLELLPPTLFFFVMLHIVAIIRALMIRGSGLSLPATASVAIAALILGKAVLLANMLPFVNRFPEKPLIWNASWKTLIYAIVALFLHYLEELIDYWKERHNFVAANQALAAHINWAHFAAVQILLITLIVNYCVLAELARVIGRQKMKAMFLGPLPTPALRE
jgi:hypothetical protein